MPPLGETTKPSAVWFALREAIVNARASADPAQPYSLQLTLAVPIGERSAPAKMIKPLVDGVIAALHFHDGTALDELSGRVLVQVPTSSAERIAKLLTDERSAVLGQRRLLWPRGAGVQWNPADDLCLALELRVVTGDKRELSGRLVELTPADTA
jgi:hypothetical protein